MNKLFRTARLALVLAAALPFAAPVFTAQEQAANAPAQGEFFIVSSIDTGKHQMVLMLPTQVTRLAEVDDKTQFLDEDGKPLKLVDFRAGDTVFVTFASGSPRSDRGEHAAPVARRMRKGSMTVEMLHRRYLPH